MVVGIPQAVASTGVIGLPSVGSERLAQIGSAPQLPNGAESGSYLTSGTELHFDVVLDPTDAQALTSYASAVTDASSPEYHHYLTTSEFAQEFGASSSTVSIVRAELESEGLTPGATDADNLVVPVTGTVGAASAAFHTSFRSYTAPHGQSGFANTSAPSLPVNVASSVMAVVGLSTTPVQPADVSGTGLATNNEAQDPLTLQPSSTSSSTSVGDERTAISTGGAEPCATALSSTNVGGAHGDAPHAADQLASYYGLSGLYGADDTGQGVTIALYELEAEPNLASDLAPFESCYGLSASNVTTEEVGGGPTSQYLDGNDPQPGLETDLDVDVVQELAPGANIVIYQGPNSYTTATANGPYDTWAQIINDDTAKVVSSSWGACDNNYDMSYLEAENELFEQAAVQGQSVFIAAGDNGTCDDLDVATVPSGAFDPASQPFVTAVGGTFLDSYAAQESAWGFGYGEEDGGGGTSLWPMPAWQADAASQLNVISAQSSNEPCNVTSGQWCREYPDVSAVSMSSAFAGGAGWDAEWAFTGGFDIWGYDWSTDETTQGSVGGTSGATPLWAAVTALADAYPTCSGSPVGFANPALYAIADSADYQSAFSQVVSGTNSNWPGVGYAAHSGYNMATGLGTPVASVLVPDLCSSVLSVTPASASPGATVTLSGLGLQDATGVSFGNVPANSSTIANNSSTSLTVTVPSGVSGSQDVTVTTPRGTSAIGLADEINGTPPPIVSQASLTAGTVGATVVLSGYNLTNVTSVTFGATSASFTVESDNSISTQVPSGVSGTMQIVASDAGGASLGQSFTVGIPVVTEVCSGGPDTCGAGVPGLSPVFLFGSNLGNVTSVDFGSVPAAAFAIVSDDMITALPPLSPPTGTVYVTASNAAGVSVDTSANEYTISPMATSAICSGDWAPSFSVGIYVSYAFLGCPPTYAPTPTLTETGTLPQGLSFTYDSNGSAVISGVPTAGTGGMWQVAITASNSIGASVTVPFYVTVDEPPTITSVGSASFTVGSPSSFQIATTSYPTPSFSNDGALPTGVTLSSSGVLSGTPAAGTVGQYTFTVTASNTDSNTDTLESSEQSFTLTVTRAAPTTPYVDNLPPSGIYGGGFTATVSTSGNGVTSVTSNSSSVCTTSGLAVSYVGAGMCSLTAHVAQGTNTGAADGTAQTFTVNRATPTTPTISNLPSSGTDGGGFTATVSTTGDGTTSVTSNSANVCTASGLAVSYVGAGTCSLTAHIAQGTDYSAANGTAQTFQVNSAAPTTTIPAAPTTTIPAAPTTTIPAAPTTPVIDNLPSSGIYGKSFTATVKANGDGTTSVTSNSTHVCTVGSNGLTVSYVSIGTCSLTAHVSRGTRYNAANGFAQMFPVYPLPAARIRIAVSSHTAFAASVQLACSDATCSGIMSDTPSAWVTGSVVNYAITKNGARGFIVVLSPYGKKLLLSSRKHQLTIVMHVTVKGGETVMRKFLFSRPTASP